MRDFFQIVLAMNLFIFCVNFGLYLVGNELAQAQIQSVAANLTTINATIGSQAGAYSGGNGFNTALIFGDFTKAITTFMSLISGHYIADTLTRIGFDQNFVFPLEVIIGLLTVVSLIYLISGRW